MKKGEQGEKERRKIKVYKKRAEWGGEGREEGSVKEGSVGSKGKVE